MTDLDVFASLKNASITDASTKKTLTLFAYRHHWMLAVIGSANLSFLASFPILAYIMWIDRIPCTLFYCIVSNLLRYSCSIPSQLLSYLRKGQIILKATFNLQAILIRQKLSHSASILHRLSSIYHKRQVFYPTFCIATITTFDYNNCNRVSPSSGNLIFQLRSIY